MTTATATDDDRKAVLADLERRRDDALSAYQVALARFDREHPPLERRNVDWRRHAELHKLKTEAVGPKFRALETARATVRDFLVMASLDKPANP